MDFLTDGILVTMTYNEPVDNTDGSALTDLHHTSVFYDLGAGPVNVVDLPASLSQGGGEIAYTFLVPILPGEVKDVSFTCTATDGNGNTSAPSTPMVVNLSNPERLAPAAPFGLSVS